MIFKIKMYGEYPKLYDGTWLNKKPCTDAFTNSEEFLLSENDFTAEAIYHREYTKIEPSNSPYNKRKFTYAEQWYIELDTIDDVFNLINRVGAVRFPTNDSIVICDKSANEFITPFKAYPSL